MSISEQYNQVKKFHQSFNHPVSETPNLLNLDRANKRYKWIKEELDELISASEQQDIYEQADAFIDVIYFALGGLVEMGIDPEPIFKVVQEANMNKLWDDGLPHYNSDGKIVKPEGWEDPHDKIVEIINNMGYKREV